MTTATKPTKTKRGRLKSGNGSSKAVHYDRDEFQTDHGAVTLYTAQDSKGQYYGDFSIRWQPAIGLPDRNGTGSLPIYNVCQSRAKKFNTLAAAVAFVGSEAVSHLEQMHLDARLNDDQFHAIAKMRQKLIDHDDAYARPLDARRTSARSSAAMPPYDDPDAQAEDKKKPLAEMSEAELEMRFGTMEVVDVPVEKIHPHPANRSVDIPGCAELAESIRTKGQQQPIKLREPGEHWELPTGHYQIVFGERRWRAVQIAGLDTIRAVIAELSDAETLELIGVENGQRKDLNDVERGRLLQQLTQPVVEGGAGKKVAEAAAVMGVAESTARNLMRVAGLPKFWSDLVVSGEMDGSKLRPLVSYQGTPILKALEKTYVRDRKTDWAFAENWGTRDAIKYTVDAVVGDVSRPLGIEDVLENSDTAAPNFDTGALSPAEMKRLKVVEVPDGKGHGGTVSRCMNLDAWRKLQEAARVAGRGKSKASTPTPKPLTAAQQKEKDKRAAAKLTKSIAEWRLEWLREASSKAIAKLPIDAWQLAEVLVWLAGSGWTDWSARKQAVSLALKARGLKARGLKNAGETRNLFTILRKVPEDARPLVARDLVAVLLYPEAFSAGAGCLATNLPTRLVEDLAGDLSIDVAETWRAAQAGTQRPPLFERFFALHTKDQLMRLGKELKVDFAESASKTTMVRRFCTQARVLPLPKAVKPLLKRK